MKNRIIAISISAVVLLVLVFSMAEAFTLIKQDQQLFGVSIRVRPNAAPPFRHWDLREFPDCDIPYSHRNQTTDSALVTPAAARAAVDAAYQSWEDVTPARIAFTNVLGGAGMECPFHRDGWNVVSWNSYDCSANQGDDVCVPAGGCACWAAVVANADILRPGPDGWLSSFPNNCCDDIGVILNANIADPDTLVILDGGNAISESPQIADDVLEAGPNPGCGAAVAANGLIVAVTRGVNGVYDTQIQSCCDDNIYYNGGAAEWRVRDGGNALITTAANDVTSFPAGVLGLAGVYWNITTGVIEEADIMLNDVGFTWHNGANGANIDIEGVVAHEVGHCIGLQHPFIADPAAPDGADGITPTMHAFVGPAFTGNTFNRTLHTDDSDGCNFLYDPDLGDAPDAPYSSNVHGGAAGRTLNGLTLEVPEPGPEHLFGIKPRQPARNFTYEWIGSDVDSECESEQVNADPYDDGIILHTSPAVRGNGFAVEVQISTGTDADGRSHDYAATPMYLNIWADWNGNGVFEAGPPEQLAGPGDAIQMAGLYTRGGIVPMGAVDPAWIRIRLDWGEDVGNVANHDGTLSEAEGAAQFGEVCDTLVPVVYRQQQWDLGDLDPCNYPTLDANPAHVLSGCVWLGGCITPEASPNFYNLDPCDDGVTFVGLPWEPCTPVTIEVVVTVGPACDPFQPFFFNFWKDGNLDRDFCDVTCAPEWCVVNVPVFAAGSPWIFTFPDPGGYAFPPYSLAARARLTDVPVYPVPGPVGPCDSATCWFAPPINAVGEVEDYDFTDMQLNVELASFDAEPGDEQITLRWTTASETNNDHFEISRNGVTAGQIEGAGTSTSALQYEWVDDQVANGTSYTYVLIAVDVNGNREEVGTVTATPTQMAAVITEYALHQNYPNPFNPETQIVFDLVEEGFVTLTVYNLAGQVVTTLVQRELAEGRHSVSFRADHLPSGIYMYSLTVNGFADQKKMLLIR